MVRTFCRTLLALFLFCGFAAPSAHAKGRPMWPIPPLSGFDGTRWGNLQIGRTTLGVLRQHYETGKGAYERSTELTQPKDTPLRVDLLWNKRDKDEVLAAITVRFAAEGARWSDVEKLFQGAAPQNGYVQGRFEDWRVARWPARGVAAFVMRAGEAENVPLLVLAAPDALGALQNRLLPNAPAEEYVDEFANEPKRVEFGTIEIELDDDLELSRREESRTRDAIKRAYAGGTLSYDREGEGSYRVSVSGSKKATGGSVSVSVSIKGEGPYGTVSASGSGSDSWKWNQGEERDQDDVVDAYRDAVREARDAAERKFERAMRESGPPSPAQIREEQWTQLIETVRGAASQNALTPQLLR